VIFDWHDPVVVAAHSEDVAVSALTLAELAVGPHLARDAGERARRQASLQLRSRSSSRSTSTARLAGVSGLDDLIEVVTI
jgi:hypothetical protein